MSGYLKNVYFHDESIQRHTFLVSSVSITFPSLLAFMPIQPTTDEVAFFTKRPRQEATTVLMHRVFSTLTSVNSKLAKAEGRKITFTVKFGTPKILRLHSGEKLAHREI